MIWLIVIFPIFRTRQHPSPNSKKNQGDTPPYTTSNTPYPKSTTATDAPKTSHLPASETPPKDYAYNLKQHGSKGAASGDKTAKAPIMQAKRKNGGHGNSDGVREMRNIPMLDPERRDEEFAARRSNDRLVSRW